MIRKWMIQNEKKWLHRGIRLLKRKTEKKDIIAVQDSEDNYKCPVCGQIFTGEDIIKYSYR